MMAAVLQWSPEDVGKVALSMPMQRQVFMGGVYGADREGANLAQEERGVVLGKDGAVDRGQLADNHEDAPGAGPNPFGFAEGGAGI